MFRQNAIAIIVILAGWVFVEDVGNAAMINAASCSQPDVMAAIESAVTGDVVVLPSGQCTWDAAVVIPDDKTITLFGQGYDKTVIVTTGTAIAIRQSGARITGIDFVVGGDSTIAARGIGWRIDHCRFNNTTGTGVKIAVDANGRNINQYPVGLIDHCLFINVKILVNGHYNFADISSIWANNLNLGTVDAVYVEDCHFSRNDGTKRNLLDGNRGGMTVLRYNTVLDGYLEAHSLQGDTSRAFRKWEIYRNTLHSSTDQFIPIRFIGGTGVIFENRFSGDYNLRVINFYNRRSYDSIGSAGLCDGSSPWDGNENETGWPCRDQIGRGLDAWLWTEGNPYPPQESVPAYLWSNRDVDLSKIADVFVNNKSDLHIKADRDYYNEVADFDGTTGVGIGTLANRPSTCTPGVGYWATDQGDWNQTPGGEQGVLYKCTAKDTWTLYYTPYTYPHPRSKPSSPKNVRIVE